MKNRLNIMKMFELQKMDGDKYKMVLYDALPTGHLEREIDYKEYDRLLNTYYYFLVEEKAEKKVFQQDFRDKSNALFYFREMFANEFAPYFA